jgi:catalase
MAKASSSGRKTADTRKSVQLGDETTIRGEGGETHQIAGGDVPVLTTQQGIPVADDQNSLKIGRGGPAGLEDFHFREKIFHFNHERIPERVVHTRGFGARLFRELRLARRHHARRSVPARGRKAACFRAVLDSRRQ